MNLLQRLKPEVLVALNEYWIKYPTLGQDLIDALEGHEWIHDIRFGFVQDLLGMVPYAPHQSVYDLFLEA